MDMVCEKKLESSHDFAKDALRLGIDGDFIYAKDTTLEGMMYWPWPMSCNFRG